MPTMPAISPFLLLVGAAGLLVAILIAFDARELGLNKPLAIAIFFAVILLFPFSPVLYLILRYIILTRKAEPRKPMGKKPLYCPYCAAPYTGEEKICRGCGRLL